MSLHALRQRAGALVYDWPRFVRCLARRGAWTRFRNRDERVTIDPATGGARCEWLYGSDLHLCKVSRTASRMLMRRAFSEWPIVMGGEPPIADPPRVSFIIGHRGQARLPHLLATLKSIAGQRGVTIECIVVEQSATSLLPPHLPSWVRYLHTPIDSNAAPYNRSAAFNAGVAQARAPLLILHDNDMLVPADYARSVATLHDEGWEMIEAKRFIFYLTPEASEAVFRAGELPRDLAVETVTQNILGGASVVVDRKAYLEIGGFDESYVGWGGEDNEFWQRAETRRTFAFGFVPLVHLFHAPQPEKIGADRSAGRMRFQSDAGIAPEERIARLRARSGK